MAEIDELKNLKNKILEKKEKKKERKEELEKRYEVMKGIPEQIIEEEVKEEKGEEKRDTDKTELIVKIERIDARIETLEEHRRAIEDRISHISEEIGELRSSLLGLDKRFSGVEINAERAFKAVEEVTPEKVKLEFKRIEREILESRAEIERIYTTLEELKKENSELKNILKKIRDVENIVEISRRIEEKMAKVDEATIHADRTAAKVEVVFTELSEKLGEIERQKGKVGRLEELNKELVKMLDEISIKLPKFVEKGEIAKLIEEATKQPNLVAEITKINTEIKSLKDEVSKIKAEDIMKKIYLLESNQKEVKDLIESLQSLKNMESSLRELKEKLSILENTQTENLLKFSSMLSQKTKDIETLQEKIDVYFELFQLVLRLPYLTDVEDIKECIIKTREIVKKMKDTGLWNEGIKNFLSNTLLSLSESLETFKLQPKEIS